jgi:hypothetical protein
MRHSKGAGDSPRVLAGTCAHERARAHNLLSCAAANGLPLPLYAATELATVELGGESSLLSSCKLHLLEHKGIYVFRLVNTGVHFYWARLNLPVNCSSNSNEKNIFRG